MNTPRVLTLFQSRRSSQYHYPLPVIVTIRHADPAADDGGAEGDGYERPIVDPHSRTRPNPALRCPVPAGGCAGDAMKRHPIACGDLFPVPGVVTMASVAALEGLLPASSSERPRQQQGCGPARTAGKAQAMRLACPGRALRTHAGQKPAIASSARS